jgi:Holliday junction resolvase RusA-like endonuclease
MTSTSKSLVASATAWAKGVATATLLSISIAINPVPASRPKVSRWGVYYGKRYAAWKKLAESNIKLHDEVPIDGPCLVVMETVVERPKTSKRAYPVGDVDNFAKGPLDVMTNSERFWKDDDQVVGLSVFKRFAEPGEKPGTYVTVFAV